jgi:hypothetical protein
MPAPIARRLLLSCLTTLSLAAVSAPAEAQLGKLKKMGADAMKEKLGAKKDSVVAPATKTSSNASGSSAGSKPNGAIPLDADHLELVLVSLNAAVPEATKRLEAARFARDFATRKAAADSCERAVGNSATPQTIRAAAQRNSAEIERINQQAMPVAQRTTAAAEASPVNMRTLLFLQDTMEVLQRRIALLSMGGSCKIEFTPAPIIDARLQANTGGEARGQFTVPAAVQGKLTPYQFGLLRERLAVWALSQDSPAFKAQNSMVFSADEQAALTARAADIQKLVPLFKGNALTWSTWNDLKSW